MQVDLDRTRTVQIQLHSYETAWFCIILEVTTGAYGGLTRRVLWKGWVDRPDGPAAGVTVEAQLRLLADTLARS